MRPHTYLIVLLAGTFACQPADTSASARQAIDAANAQWARLTGSGHSDSLAEFYAMDGVMMPPNMATVQGKDAIKAFFTTMNTVDPHPTITLSAEAVHGAGNMAMERGRWHWAFPAGAKLPPGMAAVDSGKYIVHWMQQNGKWLIADDIWNSDTPLPMPAAPPAPPARARR